MQTINRCRTTMSMYCYRLWLCPFLSSSVDSCFTPAFLYLSCSHRIVNHVACTCPTSYTRVCASRRWWWQWYELYGVEDDENDEVGTVRWLLLLWWTSNMLRRRLSLRSVAAASMSDWSSRCGMLVRWSAASNMPRRFINDDNIRSWLR